MKTFFALMLCAVGVLAADVKPSALTQTNTPPTNAIAILSVSDGAGGYVSRSISLAALAKILGANNTNSLISTNGPIQVGNLKIERNGNLVYFTDVQGGTVFAVLTNLGGISFERQIYTSVINAGTARFSSGSPAIGQILTATATDGSAAWSNAPTGSSGSGQTNDPTFTGYMRITNSPGSASIPLAAVFSSGTNESVIVLENKGAHYVRLWNESASGSPFGLLEYDGSNYFSFGSGNAAIYGNAIALNADTTFSTSGVYAHSYGADTFGLLDSAAHGILTYQKDTSFGLGNALQPNLTIYPVALTVSSVSATFAGNVTVTSNLQSATLTLSNVQFAASANHQIDGNRANMWMQTNVAAQHTALSWTNQSTAQQSIVVVPGAASGGTDYIVTNVVPAGWLVSLDGAALATSANIYTSNGMALEISALVKSFKSTNVLSLISRRELQ